MWLSLDLKKYSPITRQFNITTESDFTTHLIGYNIQLKCWQHTYHLMNIEWCKRKTQELLSRNQHLRKECICTTFSNSTPLATPSKQNPATTIQREGRPIDSLTNRRRLHENQQPMSAENFGRTIWTLDLRAILLVRKTVNILKHRTL